MFNAIKEYFVNGPLNADGTPLYVTTIVTTIKTNFAASLSMLTPWKN